MKHQNPAPAETRTALQTAIATLREAIHNPKVGLPEDIFLFVSSLTPMVNVDLLIRDEAGRTLLTWRDDPFYGPGWHIPGGIIRFKESAAERIVAVAAGELGAKLEFAPDPCKLTEIVAPSRDLRGHFISLLYRCRLLSPPDAKRRADPSSPKHGEWAWHQGSPEKLLSVHAFYRPYLEGRDAPP